MSRAAGSARELRTLEMQIIFDDARYGRIMEGPVDFSQFIANRGDVAIPPR
jgi:hypothetical protein